MVDNYGEMVQEICSGQSFALEIGLLQVLHYIKSLLIDLLKSGQLRVVIRNNGKSSALEIGLLQVLHCITNLIIDLLKSGQIRVTIKEIRNKIKYFVAVLRIHDILGWIRIRGSADPCL